jgi:hypothetical protein
MANPGRFHPKHLYFRSILAYDRIHPSSASITYAGRKDGIGAQLHSILSLFAYAKLRNLQYLDRPISNVAHNYEASPSWDRDWNLFFNLPTRSTEQDEEPKFLRQVTRELFLKQQGFYSATKAHRFTDFFPEVYNQIMPRFRHLYDTAEFPKKSLFLSSANTLKIAIHLRRGDVLTERPERASSLEDALTHLKDLREMLNRRSVDFEIIVFSQGDESEFNHFKDPRTRVHLGDDIFSTLHTMITADVFFMACSALSYIAGLYSKGIVVYQKYWHPKLPGWLDNIESLPAQLETLEVARGVVSPK